MPYMRSLLPTRMRLFCMPQSSGIVLGLLLILLCFFTPIGSAHAASSCATIAIECPDEGLTERAVQCIRGPVIATACEMLENNYTLFQSVVAACCLLAIIIMGFKITTGQMRRPLGEIGVLVIKITAVSYFSANLADWFPRILEALDATLEIVTAPLMQNVMVCGGVDDTNVWGRVDCLLMSLGGIGAVGLTGGLLGLVAGNALSAGNAFMEGADIGYTLFQVGLGMFVMAFLSFFRAVYGFIAAGVMIAFLIALAPMVLPCMLFRATTGYYNRWIGMLLSYCLQPFVIFGFMALTLTFMDVAIFRGEYSLANTMFGKPVSSFEEWATEMKRFYTVSHSDKETILSVLNTNVEEQQNLDCNIQPADGRNVPPLFTPERQMKCSNYDQVMEQIGGGLIGGNTDYAATGLNSEGLEQLMSVEIIIQMIGLAMLFYILFSLAEVVPELSREIVGSYGHATLGSMPLPTDEVTRIATDKDVLQTVAGPNSELFKGLR